MPLIRLVTVGLIMFCAGCTIQFPLAEHDFRLLSQAPGAAPAPEDEAAGEPRQLGNPPAVPQ